MNKTGFVSIKLTKQTADNLKSMMSDSGFKNISTYIEFLLGDKIAQYIAEQEGVTLSPDEEERVKNRLRDLGYKIE
jgi:hypothetical protein